MDKRGLRTVNNVIISDMDIRIGIRFCDSTFCIEGDSLGMTQKAFSIPIVCLLAFFIMTYNSHAQEKITGPWLWMIAPTEPGTEAEQHP